ncbi:unnamed protein product [Lactuca virosa]|uniref:Transmembrane protein n=1 Tax=Lactuca virosa TaxID=75947 RepID=A0AAU9LP33_9ASTR|nr:unnamed protein product [Lactuca virosa]
MHHFVTLISFSRLFFLHHRTLFKSDYLQTMSQQSFPHNGGLREFDLYIPPTEYELPAMETQVELEQMRQQMQAEMEVIRIELHGMNNILKVMVAIGISLLPGVCGVFGCGAFGVSYWK